MQAVTLAGFRENTNTDAILFFSVFGSHWAMLHWCNSNTQENNESETGMEAWRGAGTGHTRSRSQKTGVGESLH